MVTSGVVQAEVLPQGCWRVDGVTAIRNDEERPYNFKGCRLWIDGATISRGCDATNVRMGWRYAVDSAGTLRIEVSKDRTGGMPGRVTRDGDKLVLEIDYQYPGAEHFRNVWRLARHGGLAESECLPAQRVVSKAQFAEMFRVPELMVASGEYALRTGVVWSTRFAEKLKAMPLRASTPANLRRFLVEFDKLTDGAAATLRAKLRDNPEQLTEAFFKAYPGHHDADRELSEDEGQRWARETSSKLLELARIAPYLAITQLIDPENDQVRAWTTGAISVKEVDTKMGIGETYATIRNSLHTKQLEQYPDGYLPVSRSSMIALRQWSEREIEQSGQWKRRSVYSIDFSRALINAESPKVTKDLENHLSLLLERFEATLDARTMGRCEAPGLDVKSVETSNGDWRQVRTEDGTPIRAGSMAHVAMLGYLMAGCGAEKNFSRLRTMMDEIASTERASDDDNGIEFLRGQLLCNLARWARNGVGGDRNEEAARRYEQGYRMRAYKLDHEPTEAEKIELSRRFPAGAKEGFACPRPSLNGSQLQRSYLIDPRNAWETLI